MYMNEARENLNQNDLFYYSRELAYYYFQIKNVFEQSVPFPSRTHQRHENKDQAMWADLLL